MEQSKLSPNLRVSLSRRRQRRRLQLLSAEARESSFSWAGKNSKRALKIEPLDIIAADFR